VQGLEMHLIGDKNPDVLGAICGFEQIGVESGKVGIK
jgi:hypothetical protein